MALSRKPIEIVNEGNHQLLVKAKHWERLYLGEIAIIQNGFAFKSELFSLIEGIQLIRIRDIESQKTENRYTGTFSKEYIVLKGDMLIGMDGDFKVAIWKGEESLLNQRVCRVNLTSDLYSRKFLFYVLQPYLDAIHAETSSVTVKHLSSKTISEIPLPLPSLNEQHRIVAKIEELFSELDQGIDNLKTAQAQLKVYRQALLKHAFEGKLTTEWRAQNADKLESASALQQRIQHAREQRYQQQLAEWQANGKQGSKPKAPKPITPLTAEELADLPELPEGWVYVYLSEVGDLGRGKSKHRPRNDPKLFGGSYPFIQTGVVKAAKRIITEYNQTYSELGLSQSKLWPKGTLCITIAANIAETAFLGFDGCFPDSVVGFTANEKLVSPEYVDYFIQAVRSRVEAYAPATAQKNINLETLENLVVPYCALNEQFSLQACLEEKFSEIDQLDQTITTSLQQAEALRQSILKKAFSGELVPQNIEDEPASILLEKIKAEKALNQTSTAKAKSKKANLSKDNVVPFPTKVPAIDTTELHAGLMALAYRCHEQHKKSWYFGHVKAEKISHMIESFIGIDLERMPIQDAAGPNDFKRLLEVESLARQKQWFDVRKQPNGRYFLIKLSGFDALIQRTEKALGKQLEKVNALIKLFVNLDTTSSEIVATLFAAWNNLLLSAHKPNDEDIVLEARERWHEDKLKIRKERFSRCLIWMRKHGLMPHGRGVYVAKKSQRNVPKKSTD